MAIRNLKTMGWRKLRETGKKRRLSHSLVSFGLAHADVERKGKGGRQGHTNILWGAKESVADRSGKLRVLCARENSFFREGRKTGILCICTGVRMGFGLRSATKEVVLIRGGAERRTRPSGGKNGEAGTSASDRTPLRVEEGWTFWHGKKLRFPSGWADKLR